MYFQDGRMLVTATRDSIQLIDSLSGEPKKKIFTKTHGNVNVVFTHHEHCILASSRTGNNDIRYLSTYDNRYLRFFKGHQTQVIDVIIINSTKMKSHSNAIHSSKSCVGHYSHHHHNCHHQQHCHQQVTSLAMSPVDDYFLSSSSGADRSVCLWSLASPAPVARLTLPAGCLDPQVAYTHDGLIFGVLVLNEGSTSTSGSSSIRLFDARSYDKGPFMKLDPSPEQLQRAVKLSQPSLDPGAVQLLLARSRWTSFCFSPDGTRALVSTSSGMLISLDAYNADGEPIVYYSEERGMRDSPQLSTPSPSRTPSLGYCFTPDSKKILAGTEDALVRVYDSQTGREEELLGGRGGGGGPPHVTAVTSVRCNPKFEVIATSGINTMLWLKTSLFTQTSSALT